MKTTCQRFEILATDRFAVRYGRQPLNFGPKFSPSAGRANFLDARKVLEVFGGLIDVLNVHDVTGDDSNLWIEISECCTALTEMDISYSVLSNLPFGQHWPSSIRNLTLNRCNGSNAHFLNTIDRFHNVKRLTLVYESYGIRTRFLRQRIPSLEEITIRCDPKSVYDINSALRDFIETNPHIKRINWNFNYVKCNILDSIVTHSRHLESLMVQLFGIAWVPPPESIASLGALVHMRELEISCAACPNGINAMLIALANLNLLHTLSISNTKFDIGSGIALKPMTNLKTLRLVKMEFEDDVDIALPNLEHLHVVACKGIQYMELVAVIQLSKSLKSVTCSCSNLQPFGHKLFGELNAARKSSGASTALVIYLPPLTIKKLDSDIHAATTYTWIRLKKMNGKAEYVCAFSNTEI